MVTWTGPAGEYIAVLEDANKKLGAHARMLQTQRDELFAALVGLEGIMNTAESNASGNPEHEYVQWKVGAARRAIAKAREKK